MVVKTQIIKAKPVRKMSLLMIQMKKITIKKINKIMANQINRQESIVDSLKLSRSMKLFQTL